MTEQDLIDTGFQKVIVTDDESDNGYDYYYYTLNIVDGFTLSSIGNDEVGNDGWTVLNHEWPDVKIKDKNSIVNLLEMFDGWTGDYD